MDSFGYGFGIRVLFVALLCGICAYAAPPKAPTQATPTPQFTFDILPDANDLVSRLGSDCDTGSVAQAASSSSSFSMVLPGSIIVSASFSEARAAAGTGLVGTPSPFHGRGVVVTGPNGVSYNIRAPVDADFKVEGPEGTKTVVQRILPNPVDPSISFPKL